MWAYASATHAKINAHTFQTNHARKHAYIPSTMVLEKIYNGDMNVFRWSHQKKKKKKKKLKTLESSITNVII